MANYQNLLSEKEFLKVKQRARVLLGTGTDLVAIYFSEKQLIFKTRSATDKRMVWTQIVEISDATFENIMNSSFNSVESLIKKSDIKVYCDCLRAGTLIRTSNGESPIETLKPGDLILSSDGTLQPLVKLLKSTTVDESYKLSIKGDTEPLFIKGNHKVLVSTYRNSCACGCGSKLRPLSENTAKLNCYTLYNRRKFIPKHSKRKEGDGFERIQYKSVKDLVPGDLLLTPLIKDLGVNVGEGFARLMGYYLAEGSMQLVGNQFKITLNQNESDTIADDVVSIVESLGGKTRKVFTTRPTQKWLDVIISSKKLKNEALRLCGRFSKMKRIHFDVFSWRREDKEAFLIGHLLGDGAVDDGFRWLTSSKQMARDLQLLLYSLRVDANLSWSRKGRIYQVDAALNDFFSIYEKYKFLFREKDIVKPNNSRGKNTFYENYALRKVLSIEKVKDTADYYDLALFSEPHNFIANSLIVSNCPAFLYWGFKYKAWKKGYGLKKEIRRPVLRNPYQKGFVCKHLYFVLQLYPFWAKSLASKFKKFYERNEDKFIENQNLERVIKRKNSVPQLTNPNLGTSESE